MTSPHTDPIRARIQKSFDAQAMMRTMGATLEETGQGYCRISSELPGNCLQQHGFGHAALTFGIGDTAAGYAALSMMDPTSEVVTSEIKINLLAPATGDRLEAEGFVIRAGKRVITVEAKVWALRDGSRHQVAALLGTMMPVKIPLGAAT